MLTMADLFKMQSTLNERVGLNDKKFAEAFATTPGHIRNRKAELIEAGKWIDDMLKAMSSEIEELRNCCYWKHWCSEAQGGERYRVKDVAGARKEVIDLLHFWISLAQILGMSPKMVSDMYAAKLAKNIKRQDDGYSIEAKDLAWELRVKYPKQCPVPYPINAASLEDMPDAAAKHYLEWAKIELEDSNGL